MGVGGLGVGDGYELEKLKCGIEHEDDSGSDRVTERGREKERRNKIYYKKK